MLVPNNFYHIKVLYNTHSNVRESNRNALPFICVDCICRFRFNYHRIVATTINTVNTHVDMFTQLNTVNNHVDMFTQLNTVNNHVDMFTQLNTVNNHVDMFTQLNIST